MFSYFSPEYRLRIKLDEKCVLLHFRRFFAPTHPVTLIGGNSRFLRRRLSNASERFVLAQSFPGIEIRCFDEDLFSPKGFRTGAGLPDGYFQTKNLNVGKF
jgi:hypothetical protein